MPKRKSLKGLKALLLLASLSVSIGSLSGCRGKSTGEPAEVRRHWGEAGDVIVRKSGPKAGEEVVLPWRWVVKPVDDEVQR